MDKKCRLYHTLPEKIKKDRYLTLSAKNVMAALAFFSYVHQDEVKENNGWFYKTGKEIMREACIASKTTLMESFYQLEMKGYIERISGYDKNGKSSPNRFRLTALFTDIERQEKH